MKRMLYFAFALMILATGQGFMPGENGKKVALIVAIGNYPKESGWEAISSLNDVDLVKNALFKQGFLEKDILVIQDAQATAAGMRKALRDLKARTGPGDVVYVHFSSHGQQITDDNGDEIDGLDEAIVGYGAPVSERVNPKYTFDNHLRDEELGRLIDSVRLKAGSKGDVIVMLDACHSGTGTRGGNISGYEPRDKARGNARPFGRPADVRGTGGGEHGDADLGVSNVKGDLAPVVVFAAARASEVNFEYQGNGSLSVAFVNAMGQLSPGDSYRTLFSKIQGNMATMVPQQNPVIEGTLDRAVLGGKVIKQDRFYTLKRLSRSGIIEADGGKLTGLYAGTKVAFLPAGSTRMDSSKAVAYGEISSAGNSVSSVKTASDLSAYTAGQLWLFVTEQSFGDMSLSVYFDPAIQAGVMAEIKRLLPYHKFIQTAAQSKDAELAVKPIPNGHAIILMNDLARVNEDPIGSPADILENLTAFMMGKIVKNMNFSDPNLDVVIDFIPVRIQNGEVVDTLNRKAFMQDGVFTVEEGDAVWIKLINRGKVPAYVNVVDIQPNGIVNIILPEISNNESSRDYKIMPGQEYIVKSKYVEFFPPFGNEVFKVFATSVPVDFKSIGLSRGADNTTYKHPMENAFRNVFQVGSRGGNVGSVATSSGGNTYSFTFRIVESKR
jgi:metacaspase-1